MAHDGGRPEQLFSLLLLSLLACGHPAGGPKPTAGPPPPGTVPPPGTTSPGTTPAPLPPNAPSLLEAATLFLVDPDAKPVACSAWTMVRGSDPAWGGLKRANFQLSFRVDATTVHVDNANTTDAPSPPADPDAEDTDEIARGACNLALPWRDEADAFAIGNARWFKTKDACDRAVADKARVAIDLTSCAPPTVPFAERAAARDRFEKALAKGGVLYEIRPKTGCTAVKLAPSRARYDDYLEGTLTAAPLAFHYLFHKSGGQLNLVSPRAKPENTDCMRAYSISGDRNSVQVSRLLYFTLDSCRAQIQATTARAGWLAPPPDGAASDPPTDEWTEFAAEEC